MISRILGVTGTLLALAGLGLILYVLKVEGTRPAEIFDFWFPAMLEALGLLLAWLSQRSALVQARTLAVGFLFLLAWGALEVAVRVRPEWFLYSPELLLRLPLPWCYRYVGRVLEPPAPLEASPSMVQPDGLFYTLLPEVEIPQQDSIENSSFLVRTDSQGFRNSPGVWNVPISVVFLGDAITFGNGARKPFPERFSALLGQPVLNLGVGGYAPQHEAEALRRYGLAGRPSRVVVTFHADDIWNAWAYRDLMDGGHLDARQYITWPRHSPPGALDHVLAPLATLALFRAAAEHPPHWRERRVPVMKAVIGGHPWSIADDDEALKKPDFTDFDLQPTLDALHEIRFRADRSDARVVLTWVPPPVVVYARAFLGGTPAAVRAVEVGWVHTMQRLSDGSGIPLLDALPAFQAAAPFQAHLFPSLSDDHLTDAGHEVMAAFLAEQLK